MSEKIDQLPFGFARRFGVLLECEGPDSSLLLRADTPLTALSEARRVCGRDLPIRVLDVDAFAARLAAAYRDGQSAAEQVAQGLDDELDLLRIQVIAAVDRLHTGIEKLIGRAPRVHRQAFQVTLRVPVSRRRQARRTFASECDAPLARCSAPSNQALLPLSFGASPRLGMPSFRSCSVGPPPSAIHGRGRLTRHPCRVAHCAEPPLGLSRGRPPPQHREAAFGPTWASSGRASLT